MATILARTRSAAARCTYLRRDGCARPIRRTVPAIRRRSSSPPTSQMRPDSLSAFSLVTFPESSPPRRFSTGCHRTSRRSCWGTRTSIRRRATRRSTPRKPSTHIAPSSPGGASCARARNTAPRSTPDTPTYGSQRPGGVTPFGFARYAAMSGGFAHRRRSSRPRSPSLFGESISRGTECPQVFGGDVVGHASPHTRVATSFRVGRYHYCRADPTPTLGPTDRGDRDHGDSADGQRPHRCREP